MKLLHTADLHLGKQLSNVSFLDDQMYALGQILDIASRENVDAVLIAGDIYQRASPQAEAMTVFNDFVAGLAQDGRKVFVISGNHDSAQRISYFSALVQKAGVYISERFEGRLQSVTLHDSYGEVVIHMLPFIKPQTVRRWLPDAGIVSYQDAVRAVLSNSYIDKRKRNVILCHQFITGCHTSDSEDKTVGGLDNIDADIFDDFDYVALGHIHRPQRVTRDTLRYAGSPLKYSLSESTDKKCVTLIELEEKGKVYISAEPLRPLHDMRYVKGSLAEIMAMPYSEDYVFVTATDEQVPPDARVTVSTVFPNIMSFRIENSRTSETMELPAAEGMDNRDIIGLFSAFYKEQNNAQEPSKEHIRMLEKVLAAITEGGAL